MIDVDNEPRIYAYAIFIAIIIGVLAGTGVLKGQMQNKKVVNLSCEERCKYELGSSKAEAQYVWNYYLDLNSSPERIFETQKQCIDYCSSKH